MNKRYRAALCVLLVCGGTACKKSGDAVADASAGGDGGGGSSGLGAAGNDPTVVTQVNAIMTSCGPKWDAAKGWPDECKKAFKDMNIEKKDATFVALLEDPDAKIRELGVLGLDRWGSTYRTDKDLGTRAVAAVEREPALPFNAELAYVVEQIELTQVPVGDRIKALAIQPKTPTDVRVTITAYWPQRSGATNMLAYDVVKANVGATDKKLRIAVLDGYAKFDENKHDEACASWAANMGDADPDIAGVAYGHLTHGWTGVNAHDSESDWYVTGGGHSGDVRCPQVDQAIALTEQKAKAGTINSGRYVGGPAFVAHDSKSTAAQKKAAIAVLREMISNKANQSRPQAVYALEAADPSEKSFLEKFIADPEVGFAVKSALAPKKK